MEQIITADEKIDYYTIGLGTTNWELTIFLLEHLTRNGYMVIFFPENVQIAPTKPFLIIVDDYLWEFMPYRERFEEIMTKISKWVYKMLISFRMPCFAAYHLYDDCLAVPFNPYDMIHLIKRRQKRLWELREHSYVMAGLLLPEAGVILDPRVKDAIINGQFVGLKGTVFDVFWSAVLQKQAWRTEDLAIKLGLNKEYVAWMLRELFNSLPAVKPYFKRFRSNKKYYTIYTGSLELIPFEKIDEMFTRIDISSKTE